MWRDTVTRNDVEVVVHNVQIDRTYKDGDEFKRTNSFDAARDLPRVELVARKAFEFVALKSDAREAETDEA